MTGGQLHFNDASNEPTGIAHLYLIVGQAFSVSIIVLHIAGNFWKESFAKCETNIH